MISLPGLARRRRYALTACIAATATFLSVAPPWSAHAAGPKAEQKVRCFQDAGTYQPVTGRISPVQDYLEWAGLFPLATGDGVKVAVIDTGVNKIDSFGDRLRGRGDYIEGGNGLSDCDSHGTIVAGIIAGGRDKESGFTGIAPDATVISIRQYSDRYIFKDGQDEKPTNTPQSLARGIKAAVSAGADVINVSSSFCQLPGNTSDSVVDSAVRDALDKDIVVVAAAGDVSDVCPQGSRVVPGSIAGVLTVAATDVVGAPTDYSLHGEWVDIAAPGESMFSVNPSLPNQDDPKASKGQVDTLATPDGFAEFRSTGFAAPIVTGVVALVRERYPQLSAEQVIARVKATAGHPGSDPKTGAKDSNSIVGSGSINPRLALTARLPDEGKAGQQTSTATAGPTPTIAETDRRLPPAPTTIDNGANVTFALAGTGITALALLAFLLTLSSRRRSRQSSSRELAR